MRYLGGKSALETGIDELRLLIAPTE